MSKLGKIQDMINKMGDKEMLEMASKLLQDMAEVNNMKLQIQEMEKQFCEGNRAAFYFFALDLDSEELSLAANTVVGRLRHVTQMKEREEAYRKRQEADAAKVAEATSEEKQQKEKAEE